MYSFIYSLVWYSSKHPKIQTNITLLACSHNNLFPSCRTDTTVLTEEIGQCCQLGSSRQDTLLDRAVGNLHGVLSKFLHVSDKGECKVSVRQICTTGWKWQLQLIEKQYLCPLVGVAANEIADCYPVRFVHIQHVFTVGLNYCWFYAFQWS
jgi:hypothetical protein